MKKLYTLLFCAGLLGKTFAQVTFPVNGVADNRDGCYAFIGATIVKDPQTTISKATLVIRNGKITAVGADVTIPKDAVVVDCTGKYIYPSFIDLYSDYGTSPVKKAAVNFFGTPQFISNTKGAYGWNQAIKSEVDAARIFSVDNSKAASLRNIGFGTVLSHQQDGIARGTGVLVTLANERENKVIIKEKASTHYSFDKGSSTQDYPNSLMGAIALLRQTYLDAAWYKSNPPKEGINLSLAAWNASQSLPQIFEASDKWDVLRADKIGDEFGVQYIIKAAGNEYQRISEMAATKASFILPVNFPVAIDVEDPTDARFVALSEMKHWEMAPGEPAAFEKANIPFCLSTTGLKEEKSFPANLQKAIQYGLSEQKALEALTRMPALLIGVYDEVGSLDVGKLANFLITSGPLFRDNTIIYQNWIQGIRYTIKEMGWQDIRGTYTLSLTGASGSRQLKLELKGSAAVPSASVVNKDTLKASLDIEGKLVKLNFPSAKDSTQLIRLTGVIIADNWSGTGQLPNGEWVKWTANRVAAFTAPPDSGTMKKEMLPLGKVAYPFNGYGWTEMPKQENLLIKNATVWTNDKAGKLENTDVLVKNGKIAAIGKNLSDLSASIIDGTGKHLTPGIIDEHSHIAVSRGVNEGTQSVTSEVRIGDVINPDDINIYRQLSGGVTSSHILHGSANTIGGQTQLIKLRWGADAEGMKFKNWDPFIKFALGENVKQSNWGERNRVRFPQTRMGVEQVLVDAFTRARDYEKEMNGTATQIKDKSGLYQNMGAARRRDLELDALVEILNKKRFVTCHSYVQSEINMLMKVADRFGFRINTFTHILEGYKVADKMKAHGAAASTFSDWWTYKMEVVDAIPQNATIMQRVGLTVAINSDDAEMARRLNQEAAKSIKYGGMEEQEALKMVTLNPAIMLHIADRTGSIQVGKDADLVLWSNHPLSIYAKAEKTIVDGIIYFDRERDRQLRQQIAQERARLIQKMIAEKKKGGPTQKASATLDDIWECEDVKVGNDHSVVDDTNH